ncbi:hypothetical protein [Parvularcula dongshanensis]|uniref:Transporter n=1 Tax=Parvularcula dongshanensis TaxID=1173995 RepID=A0A840I1D3_9PROT|nr:hypothetical protein [Parvularcula dongshanensis]MBB4658091.1 hypothetical protein [Parvularcula dongshanensis]
MRGWGRLGNGRLRAAALCVGWLSACWPGAALASPWNRPAGQLLTIGKVTHQVATEEERRFAQTTSETYAEFGLTPRLMLGGKFGFAFQSVQQPAYAQTAAVDDRLGGLSDAEAYLQVQTWRSDRLALSAALDVAAPVSTTSRLGLDRAFGRDGAAGVSALAGYDFGPLFATFRLAPRLSLGDDAAFLKSEATLGRPFEEGWLRGGMAALELFATQSLGGAEAGGVDYSLYQLAPSLVLPLGGRFKLQIGAVFDVAGEGVDLGRGGFVGLWVGE